MSVDPENNTKDAINTVQDAVSLQASDILKPTLQDNDFLQSFVRIDLDDHTDTKKGIRSYLSDLKNSRDSKDPREGPAGLPGTHQSIETPENFSQHTQSNAKGSHRRNSQRKVRTFKPSLDTEMNVQKSKRKRRRKFGGRRQEEIYTDKDRAAAVNMGSRDIKQSLKMKRKEDRSRALQIPEEAEPSAMLALGAREMRSGDVKIAISCINKALELSPDDKNALIARSRCYLLLGEPQKALQDAEAALKGKLKDPNTARAIFYKAEALYHLGDFELSLVHYYRGMRIRPEFDQFRLGVQKAKEAIQNILGNNSVPISICGNSGTDLESIYTRDKSPARLRTPVLLDDLESCTSGKQSKVNGITNEGSSKENSVSTKRKTGTPNLLGQLNVDKKYLQNLLKRPGNNFITKRLI
ncbi:uncharacterized protein LOC107271955 isoform X1 [Cephus cinctus]|uniref:Outer dynein arm-docking complex subunit 4 n=1 Tax=Cephus cinctus TaxID=211228 RepID=A0AAJ7W5C9_CEPCN|nr:uncharacterized protein LOC107271955 isoform X1 [Cephus cinctus]